jgi:hypothetical protein
VRKRVRVKEKLYELKMKLALSLISLACSVYMAKDLDLGPFVQQS